jgi:hypothetical protein
MTVAIGALRSIRMPPWVKSMPSASSAETTRCRARALALGTAPLEPSQAVRRTRDCSSIGHLLLGQASEAASSAQHATGNFYNRHVGIFCALTAPRQCKDIDQPRAGAVQSERRLSGTPPDALELPWLRRASPHCHSCDPSGPPTAPCH